MRALPDLGLQMMYVSALKGRVVPGWDVPRTVVPGLQIHRLSSTQKNGVESVLQMGICTADFLGCGSVHVYFFRLCISVSKLGLIMSIKMPD